jgi:hypothetical protein
LWRRSLETLATFRTNMLPPPPDYKKDFSNRRMRGSSETSKDFYIPDDDNLMLPPWPLQIPQILNCGPNKGKWFRKSLTCIPWLSLFKTELTFLQADYTSSSIIPHLRVIHPIKRYQNFQASVNFCDALHPQTNSLIVRIRCNDCVTITALLRFFTSVMSTLTLIWVYGMNTFHFVYTSPSITYYYSPRSLAFSPSAARMHTKHHNFEQLISRCLPVCPHQTYMSTCNLFPAQVFGRAT